jgi:hypothetical protein
MDDQVATIRSYARYWADPDPYRVSADDLRYIFSQAGCEQIPSEADAGRSLRNLSEGCYIGKQAKHWCGIFATMVLKRAGVDVKWSLVAGRMNGDKSQIEYLEARNNLAKLRPGDVAVIPKANHHFIVIDNLADWEGSPLLITIEGNTPGQMIKSGTRPLVDPDPKRRIYGFYHLKG